MTPAAQTPMPPQAQQLLQEMHGIITPEPIGWWPPAPGWWILAALLTAAVIALTLMVRQRRRRNAYKHTAIGLLQDLRKCADEELPSETNRLLKRVALVAFPGERTLINQLFGDAWVNWLNQHCGKPVFSGASADALARGGYRSTLPCTREELLGCAHRWLLDHKRRSAPSGGSPRV